MILKVFSAAESKIFIYRYRQCIYMFKPSYSYQNTATLWGYKLKFYTQVSAHLQYTTKHTTPGYKNINNIP